MADVFSITCRPVWAIIWPTLVALTASILDLVYFFPIVRTAFFNRLIGAKEKETGQPLFLFMIIPLSITGIFSILFCLFPNMFYIFDLAQMAVNNLFGGK